MVMNGLPTRRSTSALVVWGVIGAKSLACRVHFGRTPSCAAHPPSTSAAAAALSRLGRFICILLRSGPGDRESADPLRRPISARESQDRYNRPRESASVPSRLFVALASASRLALPYRAERYLGHRKPRSQNDESG